MCESSAELGWNRYRKIDSMYFRSEINAENISKTLQKRETQVYTPGLLFRRPEESFLLLLLFSESLERNIIMMNFICTGAPISMFDE